MSDINVQEQAEKLLKKMPLGNAKIYCQNQILENANNPVFQEYWKEVKNYLKK